MYTVYETREKNVNLTLKPSFTVQFIYLKIILLQCF